MKQPELTPLQHDARARLLDFGIRMLGLSADEMLLIFSKRLSKQRIYQITNNYRSKQLKS